ncbi:MAG: Chemotaxis protein methyltransferase Cher2 [Pseudomonadota bacterium]
MPESFDNLINQMKDAVSTANDTRKLINEPIKPVARPAPPSGDEQLGLIHQLMLGVESRYGIKPGTLVERKLARILSEMPIAVLREWVQSLNACSAEHPDWQSLVESLTVHETYFCRDPELMNMVARDILPDIIERRQSHQQLRVWSAASSSGEEVYDLSFMCLQGLQRAGKAKVSAERGIIPSPGWMLWVLGTDVSNQALRTAREGVYGDLGMGSFRNLPDQWKTMFEEVKMPPENAISGVRYLRVRDFVREWVRFERFNLVNSRPPVQGMDLVFCRNVLIYFEDPVKQAVQRMLAKSLSPGGVLVMGASVQMLVPEYFTQKNGTGGPWYVRNEVLA